MTGSRGDTLYRVGDRLHKVGLYVGAALAVVAIVVGIWLIGQVFWDSF